MQINNQISSINANQKQMQRKKERKKERKKDFSYYLIFILNQIVMVERKYGEKKKLDNEYFVCLFYLFAFD